MKKIIGALIFILIIIVAGAFYYSTNLNAVNLRDKSQKIFVVEQGAGIRAISKDLQNEGLIKNSIIFFLYVKKEGIDKKIQAGDFKLSPSMSSKEVANQLTTGTLDIWVTIPEGKRAEEVAQILKEKMPSYDESWDEVLIANEGYLFPDTYLLPRESSIEDIISILTNTFEQKYESLDSSNNSLSKADTVILASLIEREAKHKEDLPIVSSVMHNRLDISMPLQIDATIQYAKGRGNSTNWWRPVLLAEYQSVKSDYNTYLINSLPPTPIASPGIQALSAAINPTQTDYLYYITDQNGINRYSKTLEQHNTNIDKYGL